MDSGLYLFTLGMFRVMRGDTPVPVGAGKPAALLCYLAVESATRHRRDRLAEIFWPQLSPEAGRFNLRHTLFSLRQLLDAAAPDHEFFASGRDWIQFDPGQRQWLDAAVLANAVSCENRTRCRACLARMEEAAALYQGDFMAGLSLADCAEFEEWQTERRDALHRQMLALLERLCDCHVQQGNPGAAVRHAQRHLELEPWDEAALRRTMQAHALVGQAHAALRRYETFCRALATELAARPQPETQALAERIRCGELDAARPAPVPVPLPGPRAQERRQVTVLACELVPTAAAPWNDDPAHLQRVQHHCMERLQQWGGYPLATPIGLLAYFGYPEAREEAAREAVRAALALNGEAAAWGEIRPRIGIHTDVILTGDDHAQPDPAGLASGTALRLALTAPAGGVVISDATHRLVAGWFHCAPHATVPLARAGESTAAQRITGLTAALSRLDTQAGALSPFTGRDTELRRLLALWTAARAGRWHAALVSGEPGIGKTRLVAEAVRRVAADLCVVRELRCREDLSATPFHPVIHLMEQLYGLSPEDPPTSRMARVSASIERYPLATADVIPYVAELLSLPQSEAALPADPEQRRRNTFDAILAIVRAQASQQPMLIVVEDLHWADASTLELLARIAAERAPLPLLLLLTARPEFQPRWGVALERLALAPLSSDDAAALVQRIGADRLPTAAVDQVVGAADGVPLFIEEMTRMLLDGGTQEAPPIPRTLRDLLAARIDRLGANARGMAQIGAVIGREFDSALLHAVAPLGYPEARKALLALEEAGLVHKNVLHDRTRYRFRHALIQEVAYHLLTGPARRASHLRVAQALASRDYEAPEVLARHFFEGGDAHAAADWWLRAAANAGSRYAHDEALIHLDHALAACGRLDPGAERDALELRILVERAGALGETRDYGSEAIHQTAARALELSRRTGETLGLFRSLWALYLGAGARTGHRDALSYAPHLLEIAQQDGRASLLMATRYAFTRSSYSAGRFADCAGHVAEARRLHGGADDAEMYALFGEHLLASTLLWGAWAEWALGRPATARAWTGEALAITQASGHPPSRAIALCMAGLLHRRLREPEAAARCAADLAALATRHGLPFWHLAAGILAGWAEAARGQSTGLLRLEALRDEVFGDVIIYFLEILADAHGLLGQRTEQLELIDEALALVPRTDEYHMEAELYRMKGECVAAAMGDTASAKAWLERAAGIAARQEARMLEIHAIESLARMEHGPERREAYRRRLDDLIRQCPEVDVQPD